MENRVYLDQNDKNVYIDVYLPETKDLSCPAILVIPGGAYQDVCEFHEGGHVARAFVGYGYAAFVLNYRVAGQTVFPGQLIDASRAIVHIRDNAKEYGVDSARVYAVGFSAGGHLAGSLAILHNNKTVLDTLGIREGYNKPTAAILSYPVVSAYLHSHDYSFMKLLGKPFSEITDGEKQAVSLEANVTADSAPLFIWHTAEDKEVDPIPAMVLAEEYLRHKLPVNLRLYPYGPHGISLGTKVSEDGNPEWVQPLATGWVEDAVRWFETL